MNRIKSVIREVSNSAIFILFVTVKWDVTCSSSYALYFSKCFIHLIFMSANDGLNIWFMT